MSDKSRFVDGSLIQFAAVFAALLALGIVGSVLSAMGMSASFLSLIFIFVILIAASVLCSKPAAQLPSGAVMALSIESLSAFGLFGIVGAVFAFGHDGLAIVIGLAAGFVLSLLFVAPRFSAVPARSLPDFLSLRYGSDTLRYLALGVMTIVAVLFIAAQLVASGLVAAQGLGVAPAAGVMIGVLAILVLALPLQRGALSKAQTGLAVAALAGGLIVAVWLSSSGAGVFVPHVAYGGLFTDIDAAESRLGLETHFGQPGESIGFGGALALIVCLGIGAAVMPHLLARATVQGSPAKTQHVLRRGLILFVLLAAALPALGVMARLELLTLFATAQNAVAADALPAALLEGARVCQASAATMREACAAQGYTGGVPIEEFVTDPQAVLIALPSLLGVSGWLAALLALVGLSVAAVAGASAAHTLASAFNSRTPAADASSNMGVATFAVTMVAAIIAATSGLGIMSLGAWAYSLIGAAFVGPLLVGLSWPRTSKNGAFAGMVGGFAVTAIYIIGAQWGFDLTSETGDEWLWFGIPAMTAGVFGIVASVALTVVVSLIGPKPRPSQVAFMGPVFDARSIEDPEVLE